jgi:predicted Zn-dependent peptidase
VAEAERMSNLNVDDANFKSERAVVEEEYRQRVLASPTGVSTNRSRRARTPCTRTGAA